VVDILRKGGLLFIIIMILTTLTNLTKVIEILISDCYAQSRVRNYILTLKRSADHPYHDCVVCLNLIVFSANTGPMAITLSEPQEYQTNIQYTSMTQQYVGDSVSDFICREHIYLIARIQRDITEYFTTRWPATTLFTLICEDEERA
jgi:hypothetical protein